MTDQTVLDNQALIAFWDQAFTLTEEDRAAHAQADADSWKDLAPSEKLFRAACELGKCKKVLDYGCGNAWGSIVAAKSGCGDVTAVDVAPGAAQSAQFLTELYGVKEQVSISCVSPDWLSYVPSDTYDGFICSNVLDVVPAETAEAIIREAAWAVTPDARVIIGLNYYLSAEAAASRGMELLEERKLYVNGVLRLVSRTDEEWAEVFAPYFSVEQLDHFAWPGESSETRRLFILRRRKDCQ